MKIKLSKSQWDTIGKKAGWIKKAQWNKKEDCNLALNRLEQLESTLNASPMNVRDIIVAGESISIIKNIIESIIAKQNTLGYDNQKILQTNIDYLNRMVESVRNTKKVEQSWEAGAKSAYQKLKDILQKYCATI